jgi:L-ascorbate metabolism protein UlaG (beta-lactamase superfamily)
MPYDYKGVRIEWLGHDSFRITAEKTIYIDPYQIAGGRPADIILISHDHFDHLSIDDIRKILQPETVIVASENCSPQLREVKARRVELVKPGSKITVSGVGVEAVPAYNVNKFREPGLVFHPRSYGGVGFIITVSGVSIYHAGDTDFIDEMRNIKVDVALLPVSGTYVMTAEEAAKAADAIKPAVAIPMHYGAIVGSLKDAQEFKRLCKCETVILEKER